MLTLQLRLLLLPLLLLLLQPPPPLPPAATVPPPLTTCPLLLPVVALAPACARPLLTQIVGVVGIAAIVRKVDIVVAPRPTFPGERWWMQ